MSLWNLSAKSFSDISIDYDNLLQNLKTTKPAFLDLKYSKSFKKEWEVQSSRANTSLPLGVIGLGGSSLGLKAILNACWPDTLDSRVHFFDNIDPIEHYRTLKNLNNPKAMNWVVISKSGSTMETLTLLESLFFFYKNELNADFSKQMFIVSEDKANPLTNLAKSWNSPIFTLPENLGGRFSVFSSVGLLPLHLLGLNCDSLLEGAQLGFESDQNVVGLAKFLIPNSSSLETFYLCTYTDRLLSFLSWTNQLWSESLGKKSRKDGSPSNGVGPLVPFRGASDQHSILQQILESSFSKKALFLRSKDSEKSKDFESPGLFEALDFRALSLGQLMETEVNATIQTFDDLKISNASFEATTLSPKSIGSLMGSFMVTIALIADALEIDAYNQPAVEIGKKIAKAHLAKT